MSHFGTYDEVAKDFDWSISEKELDYKKGGELNIGWYCSDRICHLGKADKPALIWENSAGLEKRYTYNDVRLASNTIGFYLKRLGIKEGDRVCLFMDKIPELYLGFLGILKIGAIAQPLFSAFGEESLYVRLANATTTAIITQRKHVGKVRKIIEKLPSLKHIIVVYHGRKYAGCSLKPVLAGCRDTAVPGPFYQLKPFIHFALLCQHSKGAG